MASAAWTSGGQWQMILGLAASWRRSNAPGSSWIGRGLWRGRGRQNLLRQRSVKGSPPPAALHCRPPALHGELKLLGPVCLALVMGSCNILHGQQQECCQAGSSSEQLEQAFSFFTCTSCCLTGSLYLFWPHKERVSSIVPLRCFRSKLCCFLYSVPAMTTIVQAVLLSCCLAAALVLTHVPGAQGAFRR
jgi:hypothetical protein